MAIISQHCWMLHAASVWTSRCILLAVVVQSLKPVKLLATCKRTLKTPNTHASQPLTDVITEAAVSSQLFNDPECWSGRGFNPRPPAEQTSALPIELSGMRQVIIVNYQSHVQKMLSVN